MKTLFSIILCAVFFQNLNAQSTTKLDNLTLFTGKYQFTDNKMTFLQITSKDNNLVLKQLWDNQEIIFKKMGALTFYNEERSFPLVFTKNNDGKVIQLLAFNRDVWNKVPDNYTPELQKIISLKPEQLKTMEGQYKLKEGDGDADDFLQITAIDSHLLLKQLWNQQEVNIWPVSAVDFFNDKQTFPIKFILADNGTVTQLVANNKDIWIKVK